MIVSQSHPNNSATYRARNPDEWMWGTQEQLFAGILDELKWQSWTKTKDAGKASNPPPALTPRPGVKLPTNEMRIGTAMTIDEFERRYAEKLARAA